MSIDGNWIRKHEAKEAPFYEEEKKEQYTMRDVQKKSFEKYVSNGMDEVMAYMFAYGISHEDAVQIVNEENYNNLVSSGLSPEMARAIAFKSSEEESNLKTR